MARIIDITDKLGLGGQPRLAIAGEEFEVDDSAVNVLAIMAEVKDVEHVTPESVLGVYERLFDGPTRERIDALGLSFDDFSTLVFSALDLAVGDDGGDSGNAGTPATA